MTKILIDRSVVEQALEDLEITINYVQSPTRRDDMRDSIEALRAALEQPQVEQPPRQPLTLDQILDAIRPAWSDPTCTLEHVVRAIEEAIWKKNS